MWSLLFSGLPFAALLAFVCSKKPQQKKEKSRRARTYSSSPSPPVRSSSGEVKRPPKGTTLDDPKGASSTSKDTPPASKDTPPASKEEHKEKVISKEVVKEPTSLDVPMRPRAQPPTDHKSESEEQRRDTEITGQKKTTKSGSDLERHLPQLDRTQKSRGEPMKTRSTTRDLNKEKQNGGETPVPDKTQSD